MTAFRGKMRKYAKLLGPMAKEGVGFRPMVWSAEGRAHPVVTRVLTYAAEQASRKHEDVSAKTFLQRWRREIAVAIEKRLARMLKACLPAPSRRSRQLLWGRSAYISTIFAVSGALRSSFFFILGAPSCDETYVDIRNEAESC